MFLNIKIAEKNEATKTWEWEQNQQEECRHAPTMHFYQSKASTSATVHFYNEKKYPSDN